MVQRICFSRLRADAVIPSKRPEDAGYDIYACLEADFIRLEPLETRPIPTGIASACSPDYYFQLFERGSTGTRGIAQRCGVIDSGYRGEWFIPLTNLNRLPLYFARESMRGPLEPRAERGELLVYYTSKAIAQAVLLPVPKTEVVELPYDELTHIASVRGSGRLGSSGK